MTHIRYQLNQYFCLTYRNVLESINLMLNKLNGLFINEFKCLVSWTPLYNYLI